MKILLFQMYGNRRAYHLELTYSILSAARFLSDNQSGIQIVLAADEENMRPDLPVDHLLMTPQMMNEWQMEGTYNHAIQAYSLHHAAQVYDAPVILVDSDTIIQQHPDLLFERIKPGSTLMHTREFRLSESPNWSEWKALIQSTGGEVGTQRITSDTTMYNAGVLGIHPQDSHLMHEVKAAMIDIRKNSDIFTAVQLAASIVFEQKTNLTICDDLVDHYWDGPRAYYHYQMNRMFPGVLEGAGIEDGEMQLEPLCKDLRGTLSSRIAARIKRLQRRAGPEYGAAYAAYISGLALRNTDAALANVWADRSLNLLQWALRQERPVGIRHDFHLFTEGAIDQQVWMKPELRDRWRSYWADAKTCSTERLSQ